jgi:thioredoxin 1
MSATVEIGEATFEASVGRPGILLIDWWAPWCGPCRAFAPVYENVAARHPDVTFAKINTEAEPGLASAAGIRAIPTLMVIRGGILLRSQVGTLSEAALEDLVRRARGVETE